MRALSLLLVAALTSPAFAAAPTAREFVELPPGRYTIAVAGLQTAICGRAIAAEWAKLPEVASANVDFEKSVADVVVRIDRTLKVAALRKSLRRAERVANLGGRYDVREISYRLAK